VAFEGGLWLVPGRQKAPSFIIDDAMPLTDRMQPARNRDCKVEGIDERAIASGRGWLRKPPLVKNDHRARKRSLRGGDP